MQGDISAQLRSTSLLSQDLEVNNTVKKIKKSNQQLVIFDMLWYLEVAIHFMILSLSQLTTGDPFARNY